MEAIEIIDKCRFQFHINEGIETRFGEYGIKLVSISDMHERGVDTSLANNPTKSVYEMPDGYKLTVYSIFKRNDKNERDGNPLIYALKNEKNFQFASAYIEKLFWTRFNEIVDKFIQQFQEDVVIVTTKPSSFKTGIIVPSSKPLNSVVAENIANKISSMQIIKDVLLKKDVDEIYYTCADPNSYFAKYWSKRNQFEDKLDELSEYLDDMSSGFKIHSIVDNELRRTVKNTLKVNPDVIDDYKDIINDAHVLIIDDTITNGQSLESAYNAITSCYFPKSITGLTMFSSLTKSH